VGEYKDDKKHGKGDFFWPGILKIYVINRWKNI